MVKEGVLLVLCRYWKQISLLQKPHRSRHRALETLVTQRGQENPCRYSHPNPHVKTSIPFCFILFFFPKKQQILQRTLRREYRQVYATAKNSYTRGGELGVVWLELVPGTVLLWKGSRIKFLAGRQQELFCFWFGNSWPFTNTGVSVQRKDFLKYHFNKGHF